MKLEFIKFFYWIYWANQWSSNNPGFLLYCVNVVNYTTELSNFKRVRFTKINFTWLYVLPFLCIIGFYLTLFSLLFVYIFVYDRACPEVLPSYKVITRFQNQEHADLIILVAKSYSFPPPPPTHTGRVCIKLVLFLQCVKSCRSGDSISSSCKSFHIFYFFLVPFVKLRFSRSLC